MSIYSKKMHNVLTEGSYKSYKVLFYYSTLAILCLASLVIILRKDSTIGVFIEGVSVESFGMLFDIFVLGVIFNYFANKGEKKREFERQVREKQLKIIRYLEEIDDYRGWDEKEAMFRIVGNIKRLMKLGQKKLILHDCYLKGANLIDAQLQGADLQQATLMGADLWDANLRGANLAMANLQDAKLQGTIFEGAKLSAANLKGADLEGVSLQGAEGLHVGMLLEVKRLYKVKGLDPELEKELKAQKPELFKLPIEK